MLVASGAGRGARMRGIISGLAALLTGLVLGVTWAAAQERQITGTLGQAARVAPFPEGVQALVEARDPDGVLLAEYRAAVGGGALPVRFALSVPAGRAVVLRGAFQMGGQTNWASPEVAVAAGDDAVALAPVAMHIHLPLAFDLRLRCGTQEVQIADLGDSALLETGGRRVGLVPVPAASGSRFEAPGDPGTWVHGKGAAARVSLRGRDLPECRTGIPVSAEGWRAGGNEPGWSLSIAEGRATLLRAYGATRDTLLLPRPVAEAGARIYRRAGPPAWEIRIRPVLCHDASTGMPHPDTVQVSFSDERLTGCGGAPLALLTGPEWRVEDIAGGGVIDGARVTLGVRAEGPHIAGRAGCNRFAARLVLTGEGLSVSQAVATRMACAPALMDQEQRFFAALAAVRRFDIDAAGALLLLDATDRPVIRARRD